MLALQSPYPGITVSPVDCHPYTAGLSVYLHPTPQTGANDHSRIGVSPCMARFRATHSSRAPEPIVGSVLVVVGGGYSTSDRAARRWPIAAESGAIDDFSAACWLFSSRRPVGRHRCGSRRRSFVSFGWRGCTWRTSRLRRDPRLSNSLTRRRAGRSNPETPPKRPSPMSAVHRLHERVHTA